MYKRQVLVLIVVAIHNLCGMGLGLLAAKIFHIEYSKATAIAIEVVMQNSGLAVSLATANFATSPLATLPGAIFSVWQDVYKRQVFVERNDGVS